MFSRQLSRNGSSRWSCIYISKSIKTHANNHSHNTHTSLVPAITLTPSSQQDLHPLTPTATHHNPTSSQLPFGPPSTSPHLPHTYALHPRNLPATTTSPHSLETQNHRRHLFGLMCTYSITTLSTPRSCYGRTKGNTTTVIESLSANVNVTKYHRAQRH